MQCVCRLPLCSELGRFFFLSSFPFLSLLVWLVFLVMIQCDTIPICLDGDCKIQTTKQIHERVRACPRVCLPDLTDPSYFLVTIP